MKILSSQAYTRACDFIKSKARPLERALFAFHFEGGATDDVVNSLSAFQNEDGGFGQALEPDLRTPSSSAIATGDSLCILKKISCPGDQPIVLNAVEYILSTFDSRQKIWRVAPQDTNDFPHAPWWHDEGGSLNSTFKGYRIIPRAKIVGALHHYGDLVPEEWLATVTEQTVADIETITPFGSGGGDDLVYALSLAEEDALAEEFRTRVVTRLRAVFPEVVNQNPNEWGTYCISPLKVVASPHSPVADLIWDAIHEHLDYQIDHQTPDGAWDPVWSWGDFYPQHWQGAKVEWQGHLTLETLTTLRAFNRIEVST